jgi:hypothetical protein
VSRAGAQRGGRGRKPLPEAYSREDLAGVGEVVVQGGAPYVPWQADETIRLRKPIRVGGSLSAPSPGSGTTGAWLRITSGSARAARILRPRSRRGGQGTFSYIHALSAGRAEALRGFCRPKGPKTNPGAIQYLPKGRRHHLSNDIISSAAALLLGSRTHLLRRHHM